MIEALLAQSATIETLTDGTVDAHRNFVRTVTTAAAPCRLEQLSSSEPSDGPAGVLGHWLLFLPAGTVITAASRVVVDGIRYRVDGTPNQVRGARSEHHVEARLLYVEDVVVTPDVDSLYPSVSLYPSTLLYPIGV